jgi:hypothetical protein
MVPPASAPDDHADPAWLAQIRSILRLNEGGVLIGLEGAHPACAGPLIELLLEEGAPVRVCFAARELLDAPEDARVVLLHAARDAEFLNIVRPVVSERRLRVLVWLQPGDRRELSRRARDFLDWMQESVTIPDFAPPYAVRALARALDEGASVVWEGHPLHDLLPGATVLLPGDVVEHDAIEAMRKDTVVVHRPRDLDEIARFEAMHRTAGGRFGILWDEPANLPAGATRVVAEPLDWEQASEWLAEANVDQPRVEAARLALDPMAIAHRAGREAPPLVVPTSLAESPAWRAFGASPSEKGAASIELGDEKAPAWGIWWSELYRTCDPKAPPDDPALIVPRPSPWPGLGSLADFLLGARTECDIYLVVGATGSGVSTELRLLESKLHEQRVVVTLDVSGHIVGKLENVGSWEIMLRLGWAAIRTGLDTWDIRWGRELVLLDATMRSASDRPAGDWDATAKRGLSKAVRAIVQELRIATRRDVVFIVDGLADLQRGRRARLAEGLVRSLRDAGVWADVILAVPEDAVGPEQRAHHLEDIPVIDVHDPTKLGPGIGFFRELIERRFAGNPYERPSIPEGVVNRLCWGSGGRPRDCLQLVRDLAVRALEEPACALDDLTTQVLRHRREQMPPLTREGHQLLASLLREHADDVDLDDETAHDLYSLGLLRLYPTPEGGHRALPHPLLIEGLLRD